MMIEEATGARVVMGAGHTIEPIYGRMLEGNSIIFSLNQQKEVHSLSLFNSIDKGCTSCLLCSPRCIMKDASEGEIILGIGPHIMLALLLDGVSDASDSKCFDFHLTPAEGNLKFLLPHDLVKNIKEKQDFSSGKGRRGTALTVDRCKGGLDVKGNDGRLQFYRDIKEELPPNYTEFWEGRHNRSLKGVAKRRRIFNGYIGIKEEPPPRLLVHHQLLLEDKEAFGGRAFDV